MRKPTPPSLKRPSQPCQITFRETLVLRDIQGLDYREIAQVTEVPIGTVMSRLARARRRLIEMIGTESHDRPTNEPSGDEASCSSTRMSTANSIRLTRLRSNGRSRPILRSPPSARASRRCAVC